MSTSATRQIKTRGYRRDTPGLLLTGWPTHVILISGTDGWQRLPPEILVALEQSEGSRTLRLAFEDTARPTDEGAPTIHDIRAIVAFAESLTGNCRLLSVCPGGFGRSAAASWICWLVWGETPDEALDRVLTDRPVAAPNRLMIALADVMLDMRGRLWTSYSTWMSETVGVHYEPPVPVRGRGARRLQALTPARIRGGQ